MNHKNNLTSLNLIISGLMFSIGWFSLRFSFTLLAVKYGFSYYDVGLFGVLFAMPLIAVSLFQFRLNIDRVSREIRVASAGLFLVGLLFCLNDRTIFGLLIAAANILQAFYWIGTEISLSYMEDKKAAEKYSASWGIIGFVAPLASGAVLQLIGFRWLFFISAIAFLVSYIFTPRNFRRIERSVSSRPRIFYILPLLFTGISIGFYVYIFIPYLAKLGLNYLAIGFASALPAFASAVAFAVLNFTKERHIRHTSAVSSILLSAPVFLFLFHDLWFVVITLSVSEIGASLAFTKILAYITSTSSPATGVFYYESFFSIGLIIGSAGGGSLFQSVGFYSVIPLFIIPLIFVMSAEAIHHGTRGRAAI